MPLTEITAQIEIPEGFEFDRIDTKTKDGDYDFDGKEWEAHEIEWQTPNVLLRKIKPKKPAYRVYRNKNNGSTYTRDAIDCPRDDHISSYNYEWISDWIEYDPEPKKWPTQLVERIAAIDIKAAEWIVDRWDDLLEERYSGSVSGGRESHKLRSMFQWSESPQGKEYWYAISKQLGES